jgi:hypothetical protein
MALSSSIALGDTTSPSSPSPTPTPAPGGTSPASGPEKVSFDAPPGKIQLRYQVENDQAAIVDTDVREIDVPDLTAPQVQLSTPVVLRARTVKEFGQLSSDPNAVPTPTREFRRTDRLIVRFDAYGPGGTAPQVITRLLNREGQPMQALPVTSAAAGSGYQLAGMAAGEYLIEVSAHAESGDTRQLVAFRITA